MIPDRGGCAAPEASFGRQRRLSLANAPRHVLLPDRVLSARGQRQRPQPDRAPQRQAVQAVPRLRPVQVSFGRDVGEPPSDHALPRSQAPAYKMRRCALPSPFPRTRASLTRMRTQRATRARPARRPPQNARSRRPASGATRTSQSASARLLLGWEVLTHAQKDADARGSHAPARGHH
jgi:hypothetical protein